MEKTNFKKLDEDDLLEIVLEHFQQLETDSEFARGVFIGTAGKNLRFIGLFGKENDQELKKCDLFQLDKDHDFNGDHAFLKNNPEFLIKP